MARTATISPNPASRVWRGRCAWPSRSIRGRRAKCLPQRVSSAADFLYRRRSTMPVYTVHAPVADGTDPRTVTDRFVFVRDGFHFWALVFGPLWLAWPRLWLALIGYIAIWVGVGVALTQLHASSGTRLAVTLLIALLMGFEAASLWRWTFSRRKWRQLDVVVADDE